MSGELWITLSVPTSGAGATAAATYQFASRGYKPPRQGRSIGFDDVHNQNGLFRYVYDNGPNTRTWEPFDIVCTDEFGGLGAATVQIARLEFLWRYRGAIGMQAPDGVYTVSWADAPLEKQFESFPHAAGDKIKMRAVVNFEEAG